MAVNATPEDRQLALAPLDENVDHVRGSPAGRLIIEYGDYECPYPRQAYRAIEQVDRQLGGTMRFAFRHFPLTGIHPHALAAAGTTRPPCWPRWLEVWPGQDDISRGTSSAAEEHRSRLI